MTTRKGTTKNIMTPKSEGKRNSHDWQLFFLFADILCLFSFFPENDFKFLLPTKIYLYYNEDMKNNPQKHYAYIVRCCDNSLYCGYTNNLDNRIKTHNEGKGAKYTKSRLPVSLAYYESFDTKEEAMSREWHLKKLSHSEKEALCSSFKE